MSQGFTFPNTVENSTSAASEKTTSESQERSLHADAILRELKSTIDLIGAFVALRVKGQNVFVCWASSGLAPAVATSLRLTGEIEEQCARLGYAVIDLHGRKATNGNPSQQTMIVPFDEAQSGGLLGIVPRAVNPTPGAFGSLHRQAELCLTKVLPNAVVRRPPPPPPVVAAPEPRIVAAPEPEPVIRQAELPPFVARELAQQNHERRMSIMVGIACMAVGVGVISSGIFFWESAEKHPTPQTSAASTPTTARPAVASPTSSPAKANVESGKEQLSPPTEPPQRLPVLTAEVHRLPLNPGKDVSLNHGFPQIVSPDDLSGTTPRVEFRSEDYPASPPPQSDLPHAAPAPQKEVPPTFDLSRRLQAHAGWVTGVAFNQAGRLVSGGWDRKVKVWDVNSGQPVQSFSPGGKRLEALASSGNGKRIAVQAEDGTVRVLDSSTGAEITSMPGKDIAKPKEGWVYSIGFSPDGKWLATAMGNKTVRVWDVNTGHVVRDLVGSKRPIIYIAFSPGGRMLATGADDKTIAIWDVATGSLLRTLKGHTKNVNAVAFSPDGKWLASASDDKTVRVWDYVQGREVYTLRGHHEHVSCLAFGPQGKWLASGGWDGELRVWDMQTGKELETLWNRKKSVFSIAVAPGGHWMASGTQDGTISLWRLREGSASAPGGD